MGKKKNLGVNDKAVEARSRQESRKQETKQREDAAKEDAYWKNAGDGQKSKGQMKKEEQERKAEEAAKRRAENRRIAEQELEGAAQSSKGKGKESRVAVPKVTQKQLQEKKQLQERVEREMLEEQKAAQRREVTEEKYAAIVEHENLNRENAHSAVTGIEGAISALTTDANEPDKHPERRMKAAYLAFEERELAILKQDKPGLKLSQYKEQLFKAWQKSPDNPLNQARLAASSK